MPIYSGVKMAPRYRFKRCPNCGSDAEYGTNDCCHRNRMPKPRGKGHSRKPVKIEPFVSLNGDKYELLPITKGPLPEAQPKPPTLEQSFNNLAGNTGDSK